LTVSRGLKPDSSKRKYKPMPKKRKMTVKYKTPKAIKIFKAKLVANEAERVNDFHSSDRKSLIIIYLVWLSLRC
jgi:hypothetical protein